MAEWLLPSLIAAVTTLIVAFGLSYWTKRDARKDKEESEDSGVTVAKLSAEAALMGLLLDRIEKLEIARDKQYQRGQERQSRIDGLEEDRDSCKHELADLMAQHAKLKTQFEKQFGELAARLDEPNTQKK